MDSKEQEPQMGNTADDMDEGEEVEVTREELVTALQEVVSDLSNGLKGSDRDVYLTADDLAQNDWFFAGMSDEEGQYAVTMWPAEGEEEMLRIDIGNEEDVHKLAGSPDMVSAMTDDFIDAMDADFDEYEEYDEEEEGEDEEEFEDGLEGEEGQDAAKQNGNMPPR